MLDDLPLSIRKSLASQQTAKLAEDKLKRRRCLLDDLPMRIKKEMREERRERRRNRKKQTATRNVSDYSSPSPPTRGGKPNAELLTGHGSLENILFYDHPDGERMEGGWGGGRIGR